MVTIATYYYPGWHKKGLASEWNIVKDARPYFEGHYQPRVPLLGYLDDSKSSTLKTQTKLAKTHGLDAFIFDWYWKKGEIYSEESIKAFKKTETNMKFALMWTWKIPRKNYPLKVSEVLNDEYRWVDTNREDFLELLNYCNETYFREKNYWFVDGKPYFVMYCVEGFLHKLGSKNLTEILTAGNNFLKEKGYNGIHIVGVVTNSTNKMINTISKYASLGFDSLTGYNFLPDFNDSKKLIQDYSLLSEYLESEWSKIRQVSNLPYIPSISVGWDATPRGVKVEDIKSNNSFPWSPIVINASPENFEKNLIKGLKFIHDNRQDTLHICSWNEWSEGAYLEPDIKYGTGFLEKIRDVKFNHSLK